MHEPPELYDVRDEDVDDNDNLEERWALIPSWCRDTPMSLQHQAGGRISLFGHSPNADRRSWMNVRAEHGCQKKMNRSAKLTLLECQFMTLPDVI
jgi:putative SOS response-associated peptidase YedK